ncbi:hypothetical protein SAMN05421823_107167 [Catalinimonas alkaloidigena]|uniref:Uncharacterized protein n=1 Tax=Catalinimonas alkaloidigena TaxID=1075417 RepID=A0A1G9LU06_9BACT|nr:hypothetical protein SAMN05421823_107167 [Catalinimonas alkaloidigena]
MAGLSFRHLAVAINGELQMYTRVPFSMYV